MIIWCQVIIKFLQLKFPNSWYKAALVPIKNTIQHKEREILKRLKFHVRKKLPQDGLEKGTRDERENLVSTLSQIDWKPD